MRNAVVAALVSVALHGALAVALAFGLSSDSAPGASVSLDLSHVELSFAEHEDDAAAVAAPSAPDAPPPAKPPSPPPPEVEAPAAGDVPMPAPPKADAAPPLEPHETPPEIETPPQPPMPPPAPPAPSAAAPRQAKVDAPPKPRASIRPDYPARARERGEQGDVVLEISVNEKGGVDGVVVVASCGFAELDEAAARAAKRARFTPAKAGGRSVASVARLTLSFRLR